MQLYAITSEEKTVYRYMDFKYDKLDDALVFAKIDTKRERKRYRRVQHLRLAE